MFTLTVGNQKGGVGKSTFAVHLAFRAAESGYKVLLVDIDEGDISEVFPEISEADKTTYIQASDLFTGNNLENEIRNVYKNMDLIEADIGVLDVDDMGLEIITQPKINLMKLSSRYDLCIIDTPPNLQRRMLGALVASDAIVSPFNISPFSFARMPKLQATIAGVQAHYNPKLRHLGFVPNMVNSKSINEVEALPELKEAYGELIFIEAIISRACISTALAQGRAVWHHARSGNQRAAAKEMRMACDAVLGKIGLDNKE